MCYICALYIKRFKTFFQPPNPFLSPWGQDGTPQRVPVLVDHLGK